MLVVFVAADLFGLAALFGFDSGGLWFGLDGLFAYYIALSGLFCFCLLMFIGLFCLLWVGCAGDLLLWVFCSVLSLWWTWWCLFAMLGGFGWVSRVCLFAFCFVRFCYTAVFLYFSFSFYF